MIDYQQAIGPMFLYSDLNDGWIRLSDLAIAHARGAWKFHSSAPQWPANSLPDEEPADNDPDQLSAIFEYELCEPELSCAPCKPKFNCVEIDTGNTACLNPTTGTWLIASCDETLKADRCDCNGGQNCPDVGDKPMTDECP